MEWAVYVGSVIFASTIIGLLWMRNRPLRDAQGNIVDDLGRPINELSSDANVVLITLHNSNGSLSSYDLRRHVSASRQEFYAIIADLEYRELIGSQIIVVGDHNVRHYYLTEKGHAELGY